MDRRTFLTATFATPFLIEPARALAQAPAPALSWTQWGGPNRNFHTESRGLKDTWPAAGPRVVWKRPLGDGYSSPAVENGALYVMYGKPRQEVVMAADAETGKTLWEHVTPMTFESDYAREMGNGPYSTPLLAAARSRSSLFLSGY